jgi:hypothetical protein
MKKTALDWFLTEFKKEVWFEPNSELDIWINKLIPEAKEMEKKEKLTRQLFIGKVVEIIGFEKTLELLKESEKTINQ